MQYSLLHSDEGLEERLFLMGSLGIRTLHLESEREADYFLPDSANHDFATNANHLAVGKEKEIELRDIFNPLHVEKIVPLCGIAGMFFYCDLLVVTDETRKKLHFVNEY